MMVSAKIRVILLRFFLVSLIGVLSGGQLLSTHVSQASAASSVHLQVSGMNAVMSNGMYTVKFNSSGDAYSLVWNGKEFIGSARGFYNLFETGGSLVPTQVKVVTNTSSMADIAYISDQGELHYVIQNNVSGLYSYFVATNIGTVTEFRTVYRVNGSIFRNGSNAERSGQFPTLSEIQHAKVLQNETFQLPDGTIYSKYDGATYVAEDHVHGVYGGGYGVWVISASHEYNNGGPMKQELTVHIDSSSGDGTALNVLTGSHFGSPAVQVPHGKIFGPWLIYFNDGSNADAQAQAATEEAAWPYTWLSNPNYPLVRTTVTGTLRLADGRVAAGAMVTLAKPGGDLYAQGSDYIFSAQANAQGHFSIPNVRQGTYSLYAFSTGGSIGDITDQYEHDNVSVRGAATALGTLTWTPPHFAHSLWQIGSADRKADEFKFGMLPRQYGLFNQVPANLTYTIGLSVPAKNWYYAQTHVGAWTVKFSLNQAYHGNAHLTVALAGASRTANVQVLVNGTAVQSFPTYPNDATIYRDAVQSGYYHLLSISFPASLLKVGSNSITFNMSNVSSGGGVMYDTLKLETD